MLKSQQKFLRLVLMLSVSLSALCSVSVAQTAWEAKLDGRVRFYQTTELGALIVGTDKSLSAMDGATGDLLWRRKARGLEATDVAAVPGTDVLLVSIEDGERSRLEAVDLLAGGTLWRTERVRGSVMALAADTNARLLAVVTARDARGRAKEGFKRKARIHVFDFASGKELWSRETQSEIEMMPARWTEADEEVAYTLDNYRPPLLLDDRLWLFYEGVTSFDARTGEGREREKFAVNEDGLALTEADPIFDDEKIYTSGRGRVRAISRATGEEVWRASDLGRAPEMTLAGDMLLVRTGGQFVKLADGETTSRGPYGVSALDRRTGKTVWRYKGADKGLTNFVMPGEATILVADRDDLITLDSRTGERRGRTRHKISGAAFVVLNERGEAIVGGREEVAAFAVADGREAWRARYEPPGRGVLRTVAAIAARATALYFRYGGAATTAFRGAQLARAASSLRWSGLASRLTISDLTTLAANQARERVTSRLTTFGAASRLARGGGVREVNLSPNVPRPSVDVEGRLLDRLDPARQLERLSRFLLRRERLAALRGNYMYFYTSLSRLRDEGDEIDGRGLAGVNINTGRTTRRVRVKNLDTRFLVDEADGLLYTADDDRLAAYIIAN